MTNKVDILKTLIYSSVTIYYRKHVNESLKLDFGAYL